MNTLAEIYAVKDELTGTYFTPIFLKGDNTLKQAERLFTEMVNGNQIWQNNPNDFALYRLGRFDEQTGKFLNFDENQNCIVEKINSAAPYVRKEQA